MSSREGSICIPARILSSCTDPIYELINYIVIVYSINIIYSIIPQSYSTTQPCQHCLQSHGKDYKRRTPVAVPVASISVIRALRCSNAATLVVVIPVAAAVHRGAELRWCPDGGHLQACATLLTCSLSLQGIVPDRKQCTRLPELYSWNMWRRT